MLTSSCCLYLRILIAWESMHRGQPHCLGCTESLGVPCFGLRALAGPRNCPQMDIVRKCAIGATYSSETAPDTTKPGKG
ncbi:hypothetical protein LINPERHAP2_LOCUS15726 [Linum perenne]